MMETPLPDPMMELARRTFIFSSLTGLAYADTRALHPLSLIHICFVCLATDTPVREILCPVRLLRRCRKHDSIPVSYTHLDVYKRQVLQ